MRVGITEKESWQRNWKHTVRAMTAKYAIVLVLLVVVAILSTMRPNFLGARNVMNVLTQVSINGYLAIGMTCVVLTGGIDLSVGSIVAICGIMAAQLSTRGYPVAAIVAAALAMGLVCGGINGIAVSRLKMAPFVATLAMMTTARGFTYILSNGKPVTGLSREFKFLGSGAILGIPTPVVLLVTIFLLFLVFLYRTRNGRYIYAVGGNESAAIVSGLNATRIKTMVYVISGILSAVAGIILTARVTSGLPLAGSGYELDAIAAVVIGGTSLSGGKGMLWGTMVGVLLIGIINNGMDLINVSSYWQSVVKGVIIFTAVAIDANKKE